MRRASRRRYSRRAQQLSWSEPCRLSRRAIYRGAAGAMNGGNLLMPAMSWAIVTPDQPVWDDLATPVARWRADRGLPHLLCQHRSIHPTHPLAPMARQPCVFSMGTIVTTPRVRQQSWEVGRERGAHFAAWHRLRAVHRAASPEEIAAASIYLEALKTQELIAAAHATGTVFDVRFRRPPPARSRLSSICSTPQCPWTAENR